MKPATTDGASAEVRALVRARSVDVGTVERNLELTATIQAGRAVDLVTDIPGKIADLPVKVGDEVKQGQLLARLDTEMARYQLDQAEAATRLATLGASTAEREFHRAQALFEAKSLPDQQFEQARAGLDMAQLQRAQAEAAKGLASKQVRGGTLTAPFNGVITSVCCEVGEYFNPMTISPMGGPQNLVGLVNVDTLRLDLQVPERDITLIRKDMAARILVDSLRERLPEGLVGYVETVGVAADSASRTFPVRVLADNPGRGARAGMHARVHLVLDARHDVVRVPTAALRRENDSVLVVIVDQGKARRVPVTIGLDGSEYTEITSGLRGGEKVVVEGNFGIPDGASVDVAE
jgi:RND family efflux transporter MFP subunit